MQSAFDGEIAGEGGDVEDGYLPPDGGPTGGLDSESGALMRDALNGPENEGLRDSPVLCDSAGADVGPAGMADGTDGGQGMDVHLRHSRCGLGATVDPVGEVQTVVGDTGKVLPTPDGPIDPRDFVEVPDPLNDCVGPGIAE